MLGYCRSYFDYLSCIPYFALHKFFILLSVLSSSPNKYSFATRIPELSYSDNSNFFRNEFMNICSCVFSKERPYKLLYVIYIDSSGFPFPLSYRISTSPIQSFFIRLTRNFPYLIKIALPIF